MAAPETAPHPTPPPRTLRALLVGIDAYRDPVPPLRGCVADVDRVARLLELRAEAAGDRLELRVVRDGEATRDAVVDGFRSHLAAAGPSDTALFYYSGHGSQQLPGPAGPGLEPDSLDETLVLVDSRDPGRFDLADKELGRLVAEVADVAGHVLVVLDCCHSGSGVRDGRDDARVRQAPADERRRPADSYLTGSTGPAGAAARGAGSSPRLSTRPDRPTAPTGSTGPGQPGPTRHADHAGVEGPGGRYVLLAACRSDQTAKEIRVDGVLRGAFSTALENALAASGGQVDYLGLQRAVAAAVRNLTTDQSPVLEAPTPGDVRLPFLGGIAAPTRPLLTASYVARVGWVLDAGRLHGLAAGPQEAPTTVDLLVLVGDDGERRSTAQVREVRAASALLDVVGGDTLDRAVTYRAVLTSAPQPETAVSVLGTGAAADTVRTRLRASALVRLADEADGDLVAHADGDRLTVTRPGAERPLTAVEDASAPSAVDRVVGACEHIGRWLAISRRQNPGSALTGQVELAVHDQGGDPLVGPDGRVEVAYTGTGTGTGDEDTPVIKVSYTNRSSGPLHCAVLVLTELYGVECLTTGGSVLLGPGETAWVTDETEQPQLRTTVPDGQDRTTDLLKLVVSGEPFDAQSMSQAELEPPTLTREASVGTDRGITRRTALPTGQDWATREVLVTTVRPGSWTEIGQGPQDVRPLAPGVEVVGHPTARARVRLGSRATVSRDAVVPLLPPALQAPGAENEPFTFGGTRSAGEELSVLEVDVTAGAEHVTPEHPLRLRVDRPLEDGELVLPVAYDGEDYLPLGRAVAAGDTTEILLERLPLVGEEDRRSLGGAVTILFRKLVLRPLGVDYRYPLLSAVRFDGGQPVHVHDDDAVADAVRGAGRVLLVVHGIIGDTRGIVGALAAGPDPVHAGYDAVLALDYENLHTPVAETAAALAARIRALGLGEDRRVDVVAHSMGGLLSRWWIEREGGDAAVRRLVTCGTPHGGSPWPRVQDLAVTGLALALNGIGHPLGSALGFLVKGVESVDTALDAMAPGSPLLTTLAGDPAPPDVDYMAVAGDQPFGASADPGRVQRLLAKLALPGAAVGMLFGQGPNDLAVSVASASAVGRAWTPPPPVLPADCNHFGYFAGGSGLAAVRQALTSP